MTKPRVALVIPVLNEAETIGAVVRAVPRETVDEVIVVDGGSRDDTARVAAEAGARVLVVRDRGYGRACHAGAAAAPPGIDIVAFLDGDGSDDPALIPHVIAPIVAGSADFVLGSRTRGPREPGSMTALQVWSGRLIGLVLWARYGVRYTDMSPYRAIRRAALDGLGMREMTYGWNLEMQMRAAGAGLRVVEVPVATRRRAGGELKVSGSLRGTVKAGARILATLARVGLARRRVPALAAALAVLSMMAGLAGCADSEAPPPVAFKVGATERTIAAPEPYDWRGAQTHALVTAIWYPADASAEEKPLLFGPPGRPPLFEGGTAAPDAPIARAPVKFPLIVISHGTGGTAQSLAWLGTALAARGYVVAAVNHPGNNALEPYTTQGFTLWWLRARDVSIVTGAMLADREFGPRIDAHRIGVAGFSLGGYTVMELAGGVTSVLQFRAFCATAADDINCKPVPENPNARDASAALARTDPAYAAALNDAGKSYRDPRVRAAFAMAPAIGPAVTPDSLAEIAIPVAIVAGEGDAIVGTTTSAGRYAAHIPHAEFTVLRGPVGHYVFLDPCTDAGRQALARLCVDAPGVDRAAVHRKTLALALAFFADSLR